MDLSAAGRARLKQISECGNPSTKRAAKSARLARDTLRSMIVELGTLRLSLVGLVAVVALAIAGCAPIPPGMAVEPGDLSDRWDVSFDPESRTPTRMTNRTLDETAIGGDGPPLSDADAETAARAVFTEHERWFRMRAGIDDFKVVRNVRNGWLRELRLEQTYRGLPVAGAGYQVRVFPNGRVGTLVGRYHPEIVIDTSPVLEASQAEDRARISHPPGNPPRLRPLMFDDYWRSQESHVLLVLPLDGSFRLAWAVRIRIDSGFARVYLDARTGDLLGEQYLGTYER